MVKAREVASTARDSANIVCVFLADAKERLSQGAATIHFEAHTTGLVLNKGTDVFVRQVTLDKEVTSCHAI